MPFAPSPQQAAFFGWVANGSGSCVLEAVAGAGKSTTLVRALELMKGDVFFGAYNKAIAEELRTKATARPGLDISTFHAAGFRYWRRVARDVKIDSNKCRTIFREASERHPQYKPLESATLQLVSLGKQSGLGVLAPSNESAWAQLVDHYDIECPRDPKTDADTTDLVIKLANCTMRKSTELDMQVIDFDDMIFSPLFHNARVWEHDWVLVDEAQDLNRTRRALALRMLKRGGRLVAVGDPHQAIYGFTGADADSLELTGAAVNAVKLPLTITYRCPKAVVALAQQWVSHIKAADTAPEGAVKTGELKDLAKLATPGDAVLCRLTAPLLTNVYAFIAAGIPARVEGREIGEGLKKLATRWKTDSLATLSNYLAAYLESESAKLRAKEKESKAAALEDKVTCLRVLIDRVRSVNRDATVTTVLTEIDNMFGDADAAKPQVTFSTIHKAKGREWSRVVWLTTGPSPWARKKWEVQQEVNLLYVAATRAKSELILVPAR